MLKRSMNVTTFLVALVFVSPAHSDGWIGVSRDDAYLRPWVEDIDGVVSVHIVVEGVEISSVGFSAPIPDWWTGATWLGDTHVMPAHVGNSQDGIWISFGGCRTPPVHVLTINIASPGQTDGCSNFYGLQGADFASSVPQGGRCDYSGSEPLGVVEAIVSSKVLWVGDPDPPDGAVTQPLDTKLSWGVNSCAWYWTIGTEIDRLAFGTEPDPAWFPVSNEVYDQPFDPGPLAEGTTYYWKVARQNDLGTVESPVWRFTTTAALPTNNSTWGRIKALYRR